MSGHALPPDPTCGGFSRRSFLKSASVAAVSGPIAAGGPRTGLPDGIRRERGVTTFGTGVHDLELSVNGQARTVRVETRTTLLDALRDGLDMTGSKKICDRGACGGCTVLLDGEPINSCMTLAFDAQDHEIRTIEGLGAGDSLHPVQRAFVEADALQCGFCTPGFVMSSVACLARHQKPSREQIRHELSGNICRCGTYGRIFEAVEEAAKVEGR